MKKCFPGLPYSGLKGKTWFDPANECAKATHYPCFIHMRHGSTGSINLDNTQPIETGNFIVLQNGTWHSYKRDEWAIFAGETDIDNVSDTFVIANAIEQMGLQDFIRRVTDSCHDRLGILVVHHKLSGETYAISNANPPVIEIDPNSHTLYAAKTSMGWIYASKPPENMKPFMKTKPLSSESGEISFWKLTRTGPVQCEINSLPGHAHE